MTGQGRLLWGGDVFAETYRMQGQLYQDLRVEDPGYKEQQGKGRNKGA